MISLHKSRLALNGMMTSIPLLTQFLSQRVEDGSDTAAAAGLLPGGGGGGEGRAVRFGEAALEVLVVVLRRGGAAAELHLHVLGVEVKPRLEKQRTR